ncbi:SGNH/GDSL hydrolase family protein [Microbacterium sp. GXF7504]
MTTDAELDASVRRALADILAQGGAYNTLPLVDPSTKLFPAPTVDALRAPLEQAISDLDSDLGELGDTVEGQGSAIGALQTLTTEGRLSEAELNTAFAAIADAKVAPVTAALTRKAKRAVRTTPAVGAFVQKLAALAEPAYMTGIGDSTMANAVGWFNLATAWLGQRFPGRSIIRRDWSHANQRYEPVNTLVQTGTAGRRRMVGTGASTDQFFVVADSAATSPATELVADFFVKLVASGAAVTLGGKYVTATNQRSWFVQVDASGTVSLYFSTDGESGTQYTRTSTVALPSGAFGVPVKIRVSFNGDEGGNNVARFYYSTNEGASWTQLGTAVSNTGTRTIFDGTAATQLNGRGAADGTGTGGSANSTGGAVEWYGMTVWNTVTATARPVIDFETAQWNGYGTLGSSSAQFTDFVGNTVQVTGTGATGAMQGAPVLYVLNGAVSGQIISYANDAGRFPKLVPFGPDIAVINFSHNEVGLIAYRTPYKQLADAILTLNPDAGIVATAQNQRYSPATNIVEHAIRGDRIRGLAASQRYALVDVWAAFAETGHAQSLVQSDGIHPTLPGTPADGSSGYEVAAAEFESIFDEWIRPVAA